MTSKIKVDNINKVSDDTNIIKKCGTTTTIGSGASNPIVVDGSAVTLGRCGGTVALASGATQTGFGRTGTVDWQTTPKTGDFTAVNGEGYFVNTTSGAVVMTMPSGSAGAIVSIQDYNKTFDSNALTITPASGEKINGGSADGDLMISTEGQGLTFVYVDATVGWKTVHENEFTSGGSSFVSATGGTITTCGNCKIHTFTGPGTFTVTTAAACATNNIVSHLILAGGGGGGGSVAGYYAGGGGGAGGYREVKNPVTPYTASPLDGYPSAPNRITVTATAFPITVGAGGGGGPGGPSGRSNGVQGSDSVFSTITSAGGGYGGRSGPASSLNGNPGGSGGGSYTCTAGSGNTPPVSPSQGNNGGNGDGPGSGPGRAGGGGGAGGVGVGSPHPAYGAAGGPGVATSITGSPVTRSAGGAAGTEPGGPTPNQAANTGNGGQSGNSDDPKGGNAGSGIVIIRYKFQ
jgi:hypothetical protein